MLLTPNSMMNVQSLIAYKSYTQGSYTQVSSTIYMIKHRLCFDLL